MHFLNNKNTLFDLLAQKATIVTPNNRLSASLLREYFKYSKHKTLNKPSCMPYSTAIKQAYKQLRFTHPEQAHPNVLNTTQSYHLWQKIITDHPSITFNQGLLQAIIQAWEHCQQWLIDPQDPAFHHTPQTEQFQKWWLIFNKYLTTNQFITEHQLVPYLLQTNTPLFSEQLIWVCFDEFTPQQVKLQHHLESCGFTQYQYDLKEKTNTSQVFAACDNQEEYLQLMDWLHLKINEGAAQIGVVIPELQQQSHYLQRLLLDHFDASLFDISLGQALSEFPLIAHALCWLNMETHNITHHQATLLLQSPYIDGAKEEFLARSQYLQDSFLMQEQTIPFKKLVHELKTTPLLNKILTQITTYPTKASPEEWVDIFQERLNNFGFPGDYGLNSENYQCLNRLMGIFDEFRQLSIISPQLSTTEALDALSHLISNTIFQAQKSNAPIQISGLLEASGCEFDCLWVMGLTDHCLPQKTRLSPFIPPTLQRELAMPHSVPARELQFAKQTLERLQRGSTQSLLSYPKLTGDNPNLPSPLIIPFPPYEPLAIATSQPVNTHLIPAQDNYRVLLKTQETIHGGTALLANQAKCPFKAFAEHRLRAKPSLQTSDGLNPMERGQLIHKVMELLWNTLKNQENLNGLTAKAVDERVHCAIINALEPLSQIHPESFPPLIQEVEYTRLKRLILSWLEWEKQRPPFEIAALEQSYSINLAGLDFKVRVDRLDKVADKKWVIDYKSTLPTSKPWNEERPKEPQLLLYALLDEHINALLYMQLKSGSILCSGLSEDKHDISGITSIKKDDDWQACKDKWHHQLTALAEEFQQGHCLPQPASPAICQQCDFQNLCRFQVRV